VKPRGTKITNRITDEVVEGVVHADYADIDFGVAHCPRCGAEPGEECMSDAGEAITPWVHQERESEEAHADA